ncbi:hypothetical protein TNIN_85191 [Trichonephila inaurata madagascariensis]|uniref:Uncharacterized protein n=1 Tax=Trichonephila inaurata madagascariensis TaxID=2747483 RepID=A0A8X6XLH7_9ARAC|nr:hypothetical protein TNIN_85191 [Trichonephila inaurata madagascariensis]
MAFKFSFKKKEISLLLSVGWLFFLPNASVVLLALRSCLPIFCCKANKPHLVPPRHPVQVNPNDRPSNDIFTLIPPVQNWKMVELEDKAAVAARNWKLMALRISE